MSIHTLEAYSCEICYQQFNRLGILENHIVEVHEINIKCNDCGQKFSSIRNLKIHSEAKRDKKGNLKYACEIYDVNS